MIKISYIIISNLSACQQLVWVGYVSKTYHEWFQMGRKNQNYQDLMKDSSNITMKIVG